MPWRVVINLTPVGAPVGIAITDPLLGGIASAIELVAALTHAPGQP